MATLKELQEVINASGIEETIARGIMERIAAGIPELTDFSPGSPQVVIGEANAWGSAMSLFYAQRLPEAMEEWIIRGLYGATEKPAQPARASLLLTFSSAAPAGGRTLRAGLGFQSQSGLTFSLTEDYTYPEGAVGDEQSGGGYLYLVPVVCDTPGAAGNVGVGGITTPTSSVPDLLSATNPEPAYGGEDAETYQQLRTRIFRAPVDHLLISQPNYEQAVKDEIGGGQIYVISPQLPDGATADPNWEAGKVRLAIVYPDGTPLSNSPTLKSSLESRSPLAPVEFVEPTIHDINVDVSVTFENTATDAATLDVQLKQAINKYLDPADWEYWGEIPNKVWRSELIAVLQGVYGVIGVTLNQPSSDVDLRPGGWSVDSPYAAPRLGTWTASYTGV